MVHKVQPVKRRRAMQECNSPRNSRLQTHQDDEGRGGARNCFARGSKRTTHRIDRFAHAFKNSNGALTTTARGGIARVLLLFFRPWNRASFAPLFEPVTFAADVDGGRMMQQT